LGEKEGVQPRTNLDIRTEGVRQGGACDIVGSLWQRVGVSTE